MLWLMYMLFFYMKVKYLIWSIQQDY